MTSPPAYSAELFGFSQKTWVHGLRLCILAVLVLGALAIWRDKYVVLAGLFGLPLALVVITRPVLAVYQYVFFLFIAWAINDSTFINLANISTLLVLLAAVLDLLLDDSLPRCFPRLSINFLVLLVAVGIAGLVGYNPVAALNPMGRILLLGLSFLSLYRLLGKVDIARVIRFYFWLAVAHSLAVLGPYIASGGSLRSFGFSPRAYDDLAMLALPAGIGLFLWSPRGRSTWYGLGSLVIMGALFATHSRASITFALFISLLALLLSIRRARRLANDPEAAPPTGSRVVSAAVMMRRTVAFLIAGVAAVGVVAIVHGDLLSGVAERFEQVMSLTPQGTLRARFELWATAMLAFTAHPLTGIGPGTFRTVGEIFPVMHLRPLHYWVRGLSAHNLFLHYLAESGIIGAAALVALFVNQYRLGRTIWKRSQPPVEHPYSLVLYLTASIFLVTTFLEAGWMWGKYGCTFVLFIALIARCHAGSSPAPSRDVPQASGGNK